MFLVIENLCCVPFSSEEGRCSGNDVTPELTALRYTGQKNKMDASRQTFVVHLSEYKLIKKRSFANVS